MGVGEFFLTSVDFDGTKQGLDKNLIEAVVNEVPQPVLVSGGTCGLDDIEWAAKVGAAGIVIGNAFHFSSLNIKDVKVSLSEKNISVSIRKEKMKTGIVDYGIGNLFSLEKACQKSSIPYTIVQKPSEIETCETLILPGVCFPLRYEKHEQLRHLRRIS